MNVESKPVLVADDQRVIRNIVRFKLEHAGFTVATAENGTEAWDLLLAGDFGLVITDYSMPGLNGEDLCRRMRQDDRFKDLPVILLSGKGLEIDVARMQKELGFHKVLCKPFSPNALVAEAEACLETPATGPPEKPMSPPPVESCPVGSCHETGPASEAQ